MENLQNLHAQYLLKSFTSLFMLLTSNNFIIYYIITVVQHPLSNHVIRQTPFLPLFAPFFARGITILALALGVNPKSTPIAFICSWSCFSWLRVDEGLYLFQRFVGVFYKQSLFLDNLRACHIVRIRITIQC